MGAPLAGSMKDYVSVVRVAILIWLALAGATPLSASVVATDAAIKGDKSGTEFAITLSRGVTLEVFTLANPYRVIIDMPDVTFRLPEKAGRKGKGLIKAYRYGLFAARKARVVIDTVLPVGIENAELLAAERGAVRLELSLKPIDAATFGAGTGASKSSARRTKRMPRVKAKKGASRPIVVIDPGHGGIDPGALGKSNVYEKNVVLAVAKLLRSELEKRTAYSVLMTRTEDVFVPLDKRLEFSEENDADLFISLHADSIADRRYASRVRGATVYTLSAKASDETARRMAEKENNADAIAGLPRMDDKEDGDVRDILIDLVKRETANFSADFSNTLVGRLREQVRLSSKPQRSAAFKVLKQTGTPSVLVELGYLSNSEDEKRLTSAKWRTDVTQSIAKAVDAYFDRRTALAR
jgi:N-acetylmuramoyl-L-alanine amidase